MTKILLLEKDGNLIHAGSHLMGLCYRARENKVVQLEDMINKTSFLGISEYVEASTSLGSFHLEKGDTLLLYTDGHIEARNLAGEFFGFENVSETLIKCIGEDPQNLLSSLREAV